MVEPERQSSDEKQRGQRPGQQPQPELEFAARDGQNGFCRGPLPGRAKQGGVGPFRNLDNGSFVAAFPIEILMQLEPQLADVDADRAVLNYAVILGFAEDGAADAVLAQILGLAVQGSLR